MWNSGYILGQPSQGTDEFCWGPGTVLCTVPCIHDRAAEATGKVQYVLELKCFYGGKPLNKVFSQGLDTCVTISTENSLHHNRVRGEEFQNSWQWIFQWIEK